MEHGHSRDPRRRSMWRHTYGRADLTLRQYLAHAGDQVSIISTRIYQFPFLLLRRCVAPIHMQLHDNLLRVRQATVLRIPQGNRLAGRKSKRLFKMIQAALRLR